MYIYEWFHYISSIAWGKDQLGSITHSKSVTMVIQYTFEAEYVINLRVNLHFD